MTVSPENTSFLGNFLPALLVFGQHERVFKNEVPLFSILLNVAY